MFNVKWALLGTATVLAIGSQLMASTPADGDDYYQTYFYNVSKYFDASVTILDPGANAPANICANIYVLNPSEEMEACCAVMLTPDEIVQTQVSSLVTNLLNNNGPHNGVIKVISSTVKSGPVPCPTGPSSITPVSDLRAWITRIDSTNPVTLPALFGVTTTAFAQAPLNAAEQADLVQNCNFIKKFGSNFGLCAAPLEPLSGGTCPPGVPVGTNDCSYPAPSN